MRYEITQSQRFYFQTNKTLLLEDAFPVSYPSCGYDLWRTHPEIKKIACSRELGHIIFQLTEICPIRLLFDRIVEGETIDLKQSSFQGIIIGALLCDHSLTLFSPELPFLIQERSLLIVYGEVFSVFTCKKEDPFSLHPKNQGYNYGDALKSDDYPLIYR